MSSNEELDMTITSSFFANGTGYYNSTGNETSHTDVDVASKTITLNFLDSFVKALSVMIVSELGDKTFFLAGMVILSMSFTLTPQYTTP
jgi:hypothetical protein